MKILEDDTDKTKDEGVTDLKLLNKTAYIELILPHKDTVCF